MKQKVGILGYGNLGHAVEEIIKNSNKYELVAIFSNQKLSDLKPVSDLEKYKGKIDFLFLCGGSQNELEDHAKMAIKNFNIIECYDNHNRIKAHFKTINEMAKTNKKVALCSFGWDPGLFSFMRGLFDTLNERTYTLWGKGTSQGHTNAIKNIEGVIDAVQFTVPKKSEIKKIESGIAVQNGKNLHFRDCYVVAKPQNRQKIKEQIVNMKDYFEGYKTKVTFVSQEKINKIKTFSHKGQVLSLGGEMKYQLNLKSNPQFTAKVLVAFAGHILGLLKAQNYGAYTIFDLPLAPILPKDKFLYV